MSGVMIITGASRGIGAATARLAARAGYDVCVNYRRQEAAAREVVAACEGEGRRALAIAGDMAVEDDVVRLFADSANALGSVTAVVNNAGIIHPQARLDTFTVERLTEVTAVNMIGAFLVAREAVRQMSTRHGGRGGAIVNVSSAASYLGSPNEFIDYAATKGAMDTMTVGLAKEVATEGIRVNAVRPGLIYTEIHAESGEPGRVDRLMPNVPMQRGGTADEVAEAILWLVSAQASYVTGALVNVTGGR
jgi:NAD(P)-dependent dehydrogenase (short-subunit alcohol dehydrogenase family)